jgi:TonB family protein
MFWTLIAAHLVAAQPIEPIDWFSDLQWERLVSQKGGHATNLVRVVVTPQGKPDDCIVEVTSGIPELDRQTCSLVMQRARFKPARGLDQVPVYGVFRKDFLWADLDAFNYSRPVDLEVVVSRLPKGLRAPIAYSLTFAVDAAGKKSTCNAAEKMDPLLASIACEQIIANYPAVAAHTSAGAPVSSIQSARVSFVTQ